MKNVILGVVACMLTIYLIVISVGIYSVYTRKNEVEQCLSQCLRSSMERYYMPGLYTPQAAMASDEDVRTELINDLEDRLNSDSQIEIIVEVCDMEKGIISAQITEQFWIPMGIQKQIISRKTIIADREAE